MYIKKNIYKSHTKYSIEEKEKIVLIYLNGEMSANEIVDKFDLASASGFHTWVRTYKKYGHLKDNRGKATKLDIPNKGRPKKELDKPLEEFTREELIEKLRMLEDIKKSLVYLTSQQPNKNTK